MAPVIDLPCPVVDVLHIPEPVECLSSPHGICIVLRVSCEPGAQVKEATVRNSCIRSQHLLQCPESAARARRKDSSRPRVVVLLDVLFL